MSKKQNLSIDASVGGNGDIWMRLVGFYSIAGLLPELEIKILIPSFLRSLAKIAFGDRLIILEDTGEKILLKYSSLGLRDLIKGFAKGYTYILPYQRAVIKDKKKRQFKDNINIAVFNVANFLGLVHIPEWKWITGYQGYLDVIGLDVLKKVSYNSFVNQLRLDYEILSAKLQGSIPTSSELEIPLDLKQNILVFPTGTSRQFVPVWWAKKYLPDAYYAFFNKDQDAREFEKAGLKTVKFFKEPGDIITLSHNAAWTISTDSFPSHLLQTSTSNCTITITEVLKSRIISPAFKGKVVDSLAACHPCLHLDRKNHPTCAAGHRECINWMNTKYSDNILKSIKAYSEIF